MNFILTLLITVQASELQQEKTQAENPLKPGKTLDPTALKKLGWEEVWVPDADFLGRDTKGIVVENESIPGVQIKQNVTLKFRWVITDKIRIPPNSEQRVAQGSKDVGDSHLFKIALASGETREWSIRKQKAVPVPRGGIRQETTVKTRPNEEAIQIWLQGSVEVYDSDGKLIGRGYFSDFSYARFKRLIFPP